MARVDGMRRVLRQVRALPAAMNEARGEVLREWADNVESTAKARVPQRTGTLNRSLDQRVYEAQGVAYVGVWKREALEYALYVERGTSSMADQPYLKPAFDAHRRDAARSFRARVAAALREL